MGDRELAAGPRNERGRAGGGRQRGLWGTHRTLRDRRVAAELLDESPAPPPRGAVRGTAARPWRGPECPCVAPQATAPRLWPRHPPRISQCDAVRLCRQFSHKVFVSEPAMRLIAERGGHV